MSEPHRRCHQSRRTRDGMQTAVAVLSNLWRESVNPRICSTLVRACQVARGGELAHPDLRVSV